MKRREFLKKAVVGAAAIVVAGPSLVATEKTRVVRNGETYRIQPGTYNEKLILEPGATLLYYNNHLDCHARQKVLAKVKPFSLFVEELP